MRSHFDANFFPIGLSYESHTACVMSHPLVTTYQLNSVTTNNIMKDIIAYILFYMIWNTPVHQAHPTAIPVMLTLWIVMNILELFSLDNK